MVVDTSGPEYSATAGTSAVPPLQIGDFRWLSIGWTLIALGIQFYMVALIWLVLHITGAGLELSSVLVVAAVPRAITMLLSGTLIDRVAPRRVLVYSSLFSAALVGLIAVLLALDSMALVYLYGIAALLGTMDAFFYPGAMAQMTRLVDKSQLAPANAWLQGADSVANILGPAMSGCVITALGLPGAFMINTLLFALGSLMVWQMRQQRRAERNDPVAAGTGEAWGAAVLSGLRYAWHSPIIRTSLLMIAMLNFAAFGPVVVGMAVMTEQRFGGDAAMYGMLAAAFGVGMLAGGFVVGFLVQVRRPRLVVGWFALGMGLGLVLLGVAPNFWFAFAVLAGMGVGAGIVAVTAVSWLQAHTPDHMQGRMASLLVFAAVVVDPFSNALAGVMIDLNLTLLFVGAGGMLLLTGLVALARRDSQTAG